MYIYEFVRTYYNHLLILDFYTRHTDAQADAQTEAQTKIRGLHITLIWIVFCVPEYLLCLTGIVVSAAVCPGRTFASYFYYYFLCTSKLFVSYLCYSTYQSLARMIIITDCQIFGYF